MGGQAGCGNALVPPHNEGHLSVVSGAAILLSAPKTATGRTEASEDEEP